MIVTYDRQNIFIIQATDLIVSTSLLLYFNNCKIVEAFSYRKNDKL